MHLSTFNVSLISVMFGRLKGYYLKNDSESRSTYRSIYCGTCLALHDHLGAKGRLLLTYEIVAAFSMLTSLLDENPQSTRLNCPLSGFGARDRHIFNQEWVRNLLDFYLLIIRLKALDDIDDESQSRRLLSKVFMKSFQKEISKAIERISATGLSIENMEILVRSRNSADFKYLDESLETSALLFGQIGQNIVQIAGFQNLSDDFSRLGSTLGRCLDLIDMIEDLPGDIRKNRFNPLKVLYSENGKSDSRHILDNAHNDITYLAGELSCDLAIDLKAIPFKRNENLIKGIFGRSIEKGFADALNLKKQSCPRLEESRA
jgi:hypothetical protein